MKKFFIYISKTCKNNIILGIYIFNMLVIVLTFYLYSYFKIVEVGVKPYSTFLEIDFFKGALSSNSSFSTSKVLSDCDKMHRL